VMDGANRAVLETIAQDVLAPAVVEGALSMAVQQIRDFERRVPDERRSLDAELARLDAELGRLTGAIAAGGQLQGLLEAVRSRETRRAELRRRLTDLARHGPTIRLDDSQLRRALGARLTEWQALLGPHLAEARPILATLLTERMIFTARDGAGGSWYEFRGVAALGRLLEGIVLPKGMVAPTGFEPVFQP
jgi:hypothetical protein